MKKAAAKKFGLAKKPARKLIVVRKKFDIDDWEIIAPNLAIAARGLAHCQHDLEPILDFLKKVYSCAFLHGVTRGFRHAGLSKRKYKVGQLKKRPGAIIAENVQLFAMEFLMAHPRTHLPVEQRN